MSTKHLASRHLPTLGPGFTTSERRECEMGAEDLLVSNEKGVADFYSKTTARYCQCLASTLALHPTTSNSRLLFWTQSISSSGYAIMDGELRFIRDGGVKEGSGILVLVLLSCSTQVFHSPHIPKAIYQSLTTKSALSTLQSIHCAGMLHGDIRLENILISDLKVTLIDFGHSKQCDDKGAKDKEFARLRYFLARVTREHLDPRLVPDGVLAFVPLIPQSAASGCWRH